ncbi:MAG TPA: hypothetical protein VGG22_07940 [Candidatus Baltobacteraceae bacterium]|jgi:hypothetical protein
MYPSTIWLLQEIRDHTGESQGGIVRRLVEREAERLRKSGILACEVLTFPSYAATSDPISTTVIFRRDGAEDETIRGVGERLRPTPLTRSFVWIRRPASQGGNLRGVLEDAELIEEDEPRMIMTVNALPKGGEDHGEPYREWVEDVFRGIGERLGFRVPTSGSERLIGPYRITYNGPLSDAGDVGWSFTAPGRLVRRFLPTPWNVTPAANVAAQIVLAISELTDES